ncbi:MAG: hypothetical protein IT363_08500 [Methanoregulaceae archaeon]|nr:hypothetical protein [Methanoregulaceae archaeon]
MKRMLLITTAVAMTALVTAQLGRIELRALLVGQGKGKAVWKTRDSATQFQAELQIEAERLVPGMDYTVFVSGYEFDALANGFGKIRVARRYTTAVRPMVGVGTPIRVENANGATVLVGQFR